jgi:hypothetical protein
MRRLSVAFLGSALAVLPAAAGARANPIAPAGPPTITVTADWQPNLVKAWAAGSNPLVTWNDHFLSFSNESVRPIDVPTQFARPGLGPTQVLATTLSAVTSATRALPDKVVTDYTLALVLTGSRGPADTTTLSFTGRLSATFFTDRGPDGLPHTYLDAQNRYTGLIAQTATLDGNTITVKLDPFARSTAGPTDHGSMSADITANIAGPGPGPAPGGTGAPEPSTLVLSLLGLSGLGAASWRRWRPRAPA